MTEKHIFQNVADLMFESEKEGFDEIDQNDDVPFPLRTGEQRRARASGERGGTCRSRQSMYAIRQPQPVPARAGGRTEGNSQPPAAGCVVARASLRACFDWWPRREPLTAGCRRSCARASLEGGPAPRMCRTAAPAGGDAPRRLAHNLTSASRSSPPVPAAPEGHGRSDVSACISLPLAPAPPCAGRGDCYRCCITKTGRERPRFARFPQP